MMTTFFLIRHASHDYLGKALAGRLPEIHLNGTGRREAERIADRMEAEGVRAILASPLERATETAQPLARRLGMEIQIAPELSEVDFGLWTNKTFTEMEPVPEWRQFNLFRSGTRIPRGELMVEVQARIVTKMQSLREGYPDDAVAVVSHGDAIKAALLHYLGMPLDFCGRLEISPASITILELDEYQPRLVALNERVAV
jgi:broad specificity phosphatase PhoE